MLGQFFKIGDWNNLFVKLMVSFERTRKLLHFKTTTNWSIDIHAMKELHYLIEKPFFPYHIYHFTRYSVEVS